MKNFHILEVKHLPFTETKPGRVSIYSPRFKNRITINTTDTTHTESYNIAIEYLQKFNWEIIGYGVSKNGYNIVCNTFDRLPK